MKTYRVVWRSKARGDLLDLYDWIAAAADPATAFDFTSAIESHVAELAQFLQRGTPRDDLLPGLRTRPYRRRTVIAYRVTDDSVEILRLFHVGREWSGLVGD